MVREEELKVTIGVPQESALGPTLWLVLYNSVLRLDQPEDVRVIGFADDLVNSLK